MLYSKPVKRLHLQSLHYEPVPWLETYPYNIPAVEQIRDSGLKFSTPITFFVGENGSGKTTVLESIAVRYKRIGAVGAMPRTGTALSLEDSPLSWNAVLNCHADASPEGFFLRASTLGELVTDLEQTRVKRKERGYTTRSHGERLLHLLNTHFDSNGFYLLDEPETALSFQSQLGLLGLLHHLALGGAQIVCATHSPILLSLPNTSILEFGAWGIRQSASDDLELLRDWKGFLNSPERWFKNLLE
jgi:predicted ATPase